MERWRIVTELTYDPQEGDSDIECDDITHAGQELDRAKKALETLLNGAPFQHYHILQLPHKCEEFD